MARFEAQEVRELVDRIDVLCRHLAPAYAFAGAAAGFTVGVVFSGGSLAFGILGAVMVAGAGFGVALEKTVRMRLEAQVALALVELVPATAESTEATGGTRAQTRPAGEPAASRATYPCVSCGGPVEEGRSICPACSTDNAHREECPTCGTPRQSLTQRSCRRCGRPWD